MKRAGRPLWLVGFRPFFILACLSGMSLPVLWALIFNGLIAPPQTSFSMVQWHAHEMFFGFGWAVLGGFLLTATKNWVQVRGYHDGALKFLVAAWFFERAGMWCQADWPPWLFLLSNNLFLVSIVAMIVATLIRNRKTDNYRDNYFFLLILPAFLAAKHLMLDADTMQLGWSMAIGLFRMAFLVMLERTLTQFMGNAFQVSILRHTALDGAIKLLGLALVLVGLMPPGFAVAAALLLALLLAIRLAFWKPLLALRRLDIGIMVLGYLAIVAQLLIEALDRVAHPHWIGAVSVHVFALGVIGLIVPAMLIRISNGHTGRKVVFVRADKLALWLMMLAFVLRVIAPQLYPGAYGDWIALTAACWFSCFALLGWRYLPMLLRARIDGKEH